MKKVLLFISIVLTLVTSKVFSQSWTYINNTGTAFILYGMSFPPGQSTIGFACGMQYTYDADGVIVKTVDGGNNWTQIWPASGTIDGLQGIWFTSDLVGFACGWNNYFIKTTDGGSTWTPISVGADVWYYRDVEFWDANNGIAVASMNNAGDQAAFITSNGGTTWVPSTSGMATNDVYGVSYASQNIVYAVGTSGSVYKSTDGGHNWTVSSTLSAMLLGVDFSNTNFAVVGGEEKIFATNNGGTSWTTYTTGYENFYGTLAMADGVGYCAGTDENIYKTTDNGQTWNMDFNGSGPATIYRIRAVANGTIFACGGQGKILKLTPPLDADFTAEPTTVCTGGQVNFYDNSSGNITGWSWTFEGGTPSSSTQENPVVTYSTPGTFDVSLTVTSGSFNNTETKTNFITVYGALTTPVTPSGAAQACGTYSYPYTTQPVPYAESYEWEVTPASAGTMTGNDIVGTFIASNTWEGAYTIKVRAENQCGSGPWSAEFQGTLHHDPVVFDLLGEGTYCEGEDGSEITLSDSENGVTYELFRDNVTTGITVPGTGEMLSFGYFSQTGLYTATGHTPTCQENMVGQIYVHMEPLPGQAGAPQGDNAVCNDEESDYTTSGAANADSYEWQLIPPEAGVVAPEGNACSVAWSENYSGSANLIVTGINACGTGIPSDQLNITVNVSPSPQVTGPADVCDNEPADYATGFNAGSTYSWQINGGNIISGSGTNQVSVMWGNAGPGSVSVTEVNSENCDGTSALLLVTIDDCTAIGEPGLSTLNIYPNPFNEYLHFSGLNHATIRIFNLMGEEIITMKQVNGNVHLNTSSLNKSIYLVKVEQAGKMSVYQLVKR